LIDIYISFFLTPSYIFCYCSMARQCVLIFSSLWHWHSNLVHIRSFSPMIHIKRDCRQLHLNMLFKSTKVSLNETGHSTGISAKPKMNIYTYSRSRYYTVAITHCSRNYIFFSTKFDHPFPKASKWLPCISQVIIASHGWIWSFPFFIQMVILACLMRIGISSKALSFLINHLNLVNCTRPDCNESHQMT